MVQAASSLVRLESGNRRSLPIKGSVSTLAKRFALLYGLLQEQILAETVTGFS